MRETSNGQAVACGRARHARWRSVLAIRGTRDHLLRAVGLRRCLEGPWLTMMAWQTHGVSTGNPRRQDEKGRSSIGWERCTWEGQARS